LKQNASFEKQYRNIQSRISAVKTLSREESVLPKLSKIVESVPSGIDFTSLNYSAGSLTFQVFIPNREQYQSFLFNLKSISFVKSVSVTSVEKTSGNDKGFQAMFKITII